MGLYFVLHDNKYFNRGDWIDEDELGMVQKVEMLQVGDKYEPQRYVGAVVELSPIRHLCLRLQKRGIDNESPRRHLYSEQWDLGERVRKEFGDAHDHSNSARSLGEGSATDKCDNLGGECNISTET